jgi:tRNA (mo5U34)-methyltransferase
MMPSLPGIRRRRKPRGAAAEDIRALGPWFHNLHLPDGRQTAPDHFLGDFPAYKWKEIAPHIPEDLRGWRALDIGCNAGFYAFELARRGARVTGIDLDPRYLSQAEWAARELGLRRLVDFRLMQVYDLARLREKFDLVLFLGVFYHLRYPMLGLDIVARKVGRLMVFQTLTSPGQEVYENTANQGLDAAEGLNARAALTQPGWPKMAFLEHGFAGDHTNWWCPNHAGVEAMLRSAGLQVTGRPSHEVYLCAPDPGHPSPAESWNASEYLAAVGLPWKRTLPSKIGG